MKSLSYWLLVVVLIAALTHILMVLVLPRYEMSRLSQKIMERLPENELQYLRSDVRQPIEGLSSLDPSFQYAACRFNISQDALEISVPNRNLPVDVTIYDNTLKAIYTTDETSSFEGLLRILVVTDKQILRLRENLPETAQHAQIFRLQDNEGFALIRIFTQRRSQQNDVNALLANTKCTSNTSLR